MDSFFDEFAIQNLHIVSSQGCTNNEIETVYSYKMKERPDYSPKIFRQLDRDAYLPEQVEFIEDAMKKILKRLNIIR